MEIGQAGFLISEVKQRNKAYCYLILVPTSNFVLQASLKVEGKIRIKRKVYSKLENLVIDQAITKRLPKSERQQIMGNISQA